MSSPAAFIITTILLVITVIIMCPLSKASRDDEEEEVKVKPGQDVTLQCRPPTTAAITLLAWTRPDLKADGYVFFYRNNRSYESYQHPRFKGRVELKDAAAMKDRDVSVIVRNVSVSDTGTYECKVISSERRSSDGGYAEFKRFTNLTVTASGVTDGDTEDAGDEDARDKDARDEREYGAVIVAVSVSAVVLVVLIALGCIMIHRKSKVPLKRSVYSPPPD